MNQKHQEDLTHIRSMMERSSRFISLSGLSGVFAGLSALIGGLYAYQILQSYGVYYFDGRQKLYSATMVLELVLIAIIVLFFALAFGIFFTLRKSRKNNLPIWTTATKKMLLNLAIPLCVGGVFCLALLYHQIYVLIAPATLLFYGLGLINAEKYTFSDIKYLGFCQLILGCISLFYPGYGLIFWIIGFGVLHILYGLIVFKKHK
ncbi:hypothetical protein [Flavobacterium eburneipallidum]|uniref:hypothetical protein n=1 Tax=Flavobacterium eburneipallidum TaxID=3003263 RepID=UPI0022ABF649|nr:hypothetical protein [Flavobacterium eburneipallidum]